MRTPGLGESRRSSTSGVCPIACTMSAYLPPQGRLSRRGSIIASESVVGAPAAIGGTRAGSAGAGAADLQPVVPRELVGVLERIAALLRQQLRMGLHLVQRLLRGVADRLDLGLVAGGRRQGADTRDLGLGDRDRRLGEPLDLSAGRPVGPAREGLLGGGVDRLVAAPADR